MSKKIFDLSEKDLAVLQVIKETVPEVKSRVDAVRFLIKKYEIEVLDAQETIIKQQEEILDLLKQMKRTLGYTEQNSEVLVDAANTLLMENCKDACYLKDVVTHPAIKLSEKNIREKIEKNQQIKHHNIQRKNRR